MTRVMRHELIREILGADPMERMALELPATVKTPEQLRRERNQRYYARNKTNSAAQEIGRKVERAALRLFGADWRPVKRRAQMYVISRRKQRDGTVKISIVAGPLDNHRLVNQALAAARAQRKPGLHVQMVSAPVDLPIVGLPSP